MTAAFADLDAFFERTADERLADYLDLLRLPSIGAQKEHDGDMRATAEFVADRFERMGFEHVEVVADRRPSRWSTPTGFTPRARRRSWSTPTTTSSRSIRWTCGRARRSTRWWRAAGSGRVARPTTRATSMSTSGPRGRGSRRAASCRSTSRSSWRARRSPARTNFDAWIVANRERLGADLVVISDTGFYEGNKPAITIGLRGLVYMQIDVTGLEARPALGLVRRQRPEPGQRAGNDMAELKNEDGSVAVPRLLRRGARTLTPRDREEFARMPLDEAAFVTASTACTTFGASPATRSSSGAGRGRRST